MKQAMEFMKYDKITDDVYLLGPNTVLRFNVSLSKITSDGKRYHFYKEFEYGSRATDYPELLTIKRSFDYYFSLENIQKSKVTDDKAYIRIGLYDIHKFRTQLNQVYSWFTDKKFKSLFASNKGNIILTSPIPESTVGGYPQNKFLRFVPTVIDNGTGKRFMEPGVELDLSDYNNYVTMNIERFMGLYYTIMTFNMYQAAQNMVGYIGFPSGFNRIEMQTNNQPSNPYNIQTFSEEEFDGKINGVNDRVIGNRKNISSLE